MYAKEAQIDGPTSTVIYFRYIKHSERKRKEALKLIPEGVEYKKDSLIKNLYVTDRKNKAALIMSEPFKDMTFIIQDKSSCLPVHALSQLKHFDDAVVLDCTSAPGNKSIQASEFCKQVYSCEKDEGRFATLQSRLKESGASNATAINTDVIEWIKSKEHPEITTAICDPTCSGSGLFIHKERQLMKERANCVKEIRKVSAWGPKKYQNRVLGIS